MPIFDLDGWPEGCQQIINEYVEEGRGKHPQAKAYRFMRYWYRSHPSITKEEVIALRDKIMEIGKRKRREGGPYEGFDALAMECTLEGCIVTECHFVINQINVHSILF